MQNNKGPIKYLICGGFGGVCTVLSGHPMDTIKVRLQAMPLPKPGEVPLYEGAWDCYKKIVQREGVCGLYKGISAPLTVIAPMVAVSFFCFGMGKQLLQENPEEALTKPQVFAAGAFAGIFTTTLMAPGERIKCLLQIQSAHINGPQKYKGMVDCAKQLYAEGGIRHIYKGTIATLIRDVPSSGTMFLTYEWIKEECVPEHASHQYKMMMVTFSGGCSGVANWLVGMPADVLKTRLQTAPEGKYPNGLRDVFRPLMFHEGPKALYKGLTPVLLRAFPANAACFVGFEQASGFFDWMFPNL